MKTSRFGATLMAAFLLAGFISPRSRLSAPPPSAAPPAAPLRLAAFDPPTVAPPPAAIDRPATPTPIPAAWKTFSDPTFKIGFRYPAEWGAAGARKRSGADGFVEVALLDYPASSFDRMYTVCVLEANTQRPAAYGAGPLISDWQGWNPDRQTGAGLGSGCTVTPSEGMPPAAPAQAVLYARYPQPQMPNKLLVLRADATHFSGILSSLRFQVDAPSPTPRGASAPPACGTAMVGRPQTVLQTDALVITATAIAPKSCDPWRQFGGFQNLVKISGAQAARMAAYLPSRAPQAAATAGVEAEAYTYEYARAPLFPIGAPSQVHIRYHGQVVDTLAVPHAGPAGLPVSGFWSWRGHWLLEMKGVVVDNGELLNHTLKYAEIFAWHVMNNEPFYLFRQDSSYGLSYASQELPLRYDDILHGDFCCDASAYSIISTASGAWFYALKGDIWYLVQVQVQR